MGWNGVKKAQFCCKSCCKKTPAHCCRGTFVASQRDRSARFGRLRCSPIAQLAWRAELHVGEDIPRSKLLELPKEKQIMLVADSIRPLYPILEHLSVLRLVLHGRSSTRSPDLMLRRDDNLYLRKLVTSAREILDTRVGSPHGFLHVSDSPQCSAGVDCLIVQTSRCHLTTPSSRSSRSRSPGLTRTPGWTVDAGQDGRRPSGLPRQTPGHWSGSTSLGHI